MSAIIEPIHTDWINLKPVRFFRDRRSAPFLPWCCTMDLLKAAGLGREVRMWLRRQTRAFPEGDPTQTIESETGPVTITPHPLMQGMISAAVETMGVPQSFEHEYHRAGTAALRKLTAHLRPLEGAEWSVAAARNTMHDRIVTDPPIRLRVVTAPMQQRSA